MRKQKRHTRRPTRTLSNRRYVCPSKFWADYGFYLKSEEWRRKREAVLARAHYLCEQCQQREAVHIHHLSYEHIFDEPLSDLRALCIPCHELIHDRKL